MWLYLITFLLALINNSYGLSRQEIVTNVGVIRGVRGDDGNYTKFLGIPYAKVDENNVFGDPLPDPPFEGIFEADHEGDICPQYYANAVVGSLDCLLLNLYVPDSASPTNRLAVMVYIHGGRFAIGSSDEFGLGPQFLLQHDVIYIAINYRLNVFGFMCLDIPEVPGNAGLKDQEKALQWVKDNIASFNGDPDRITIFGNSAGAMSIGLHVTSNYERTYNNVIMQSGTAFYPRLLIDSDPSVALRLASRLGFATNNINEAFTFLKSATKQQLVQALRDENISLFPCVEKKFDGVQNFLSDYPINIKQTKTEGMAILQGYTDKESLFNFDPATSYSPTLFRRNLDGFFAFDEDMLDEIESMVRRFYVGYEELGDNVQDEVLDFMSDVTFIYAPVRTVARFLESNADKVYLYMFSYDGPRNQMKIRSNVTIPGAMHSDELGYIFNIGHDFVPDPTPADQLIIDKMATMWTNFAKYDDPTPETNALLPYQWQAITKDSPYYYLEINSDMVAGHGNFHKRMAFWDLFYLAHAEYEKGYRDVNLDEDDSTDASSVAYLSNIVLVTVIVNILVQ